MIKVNGKVVESCFFPDGTFNLMNFPKIDTFGFFGEPLTIIRWNFENISEQILLYNIVKHLRNLGYNQIALEMFYVPNARMDRTYMRDAEVPTLKFFADFINDLKFEFVIILDPHSDVTPMLINRCSCLPRCEVFNKAFLMSKPHLILYPDAGAMKRYAKDSGSTPIFYAEKIRDWKTGKIEGLEIFNPQKVYIGPSTKVLISDDICSKGGTFYYAAKALIEKYGVSDIDLYVTHCENSIKDGELLKENSPINHIYTTDSIIRNFDSPKITVISLEELYNVNL